MKILVAVKRVVDAKIKVRPLPDHSGVDVKLAKMAMNPFDEIAIEKAVLPTETQVPQCPQPALSGASRRRPNRPQAP